MQILKMKRTGKRIALPDRKAEKFIRMGVAIPYDQLVVKKPLPEPEEVYAPDEDDANDGLILDPPEEQEPEKKKGKKRTRRKYRRRDMEAEEESCPY